MLKNKALKNLSDMTMYNKQIYVEGCINSRSVYEKQKKTQTQPNKFLKL